MGKSTIVVGPRRRVPHHYVILLPRYRIVALPTRFSYSVRDRDAVYAHDFESPLKSELRHEVERFRALVRRMKRFSALSDSPRSESRA